MTTGPVKQLPESRLPRLQKLQASLHRMGIFVSFLCLLHCVALPLILILAPPLGLSLLESQSTQHWWLFCLALFISMAAFIWNLGQSPDALVLLSGTSGLLLLYLGITHVFAHDLETPLTVAGSLLLAFAHLRNWRRAHFLS